MAKELVTLLTDELDGSEADCSVQFGLDGVDYTIDLSEENARRLRSALDPYIAAGARLNRRGVRLRRARGSGTPERRENWDRNQAIRDWAAENGFEMSERGRIPSAAVEAFNRSIDGVIAD